MTRIGRWLGVAFALAAVAAGVACGGGGGQSSTTPGPSAVASGTVEVNVTPFPLPTVAGNRVTSTSKGYAADYPSGWNVRPNFIQSVDSSVDAIFEPAGGSVQASIAITCAVTRDLPPDQRIEFMKTNTARQGLNHDIRTSQMKIGGVDATVLDYRFESQQSPNSPRLDKQDIFFSAGKCDWTVTTTAPAGQREKYKAAFDRFLNSFTLLGG